MDPAAEAEEQAPPPPMELFDGMHVRLRSRWDNPYLYAAEDGRDVSLSTDRASLNVVWRAHGLVREGNIYALFHGAAYGRYLSVAAEQNVDDPRNPFPVVGFVQRAYADPGQLDVLWTVFDEQDGTGEFLLIHRVYGVWRNPDGTNTRWTMEVVPPRENPPELPPAPPVIPPLAAPMGGGQIRRAALPPPEFQQTIQYVRANHQGDYNADGLQWRTLELYGLSVFHLRSDLARQLGEANALNITLCVRAGSQGRLTPLVIDLAADNQEMQIVVFSTGSQAAQELVYPDVDAD
nr:unnamed protein product [Digitaria exilis]